MPLIRTTGGGLIPGGWVFRDARTGMHFDGMSVSFNEQVAKIAQHRLSNPRVYDPTNRDDAKYLNEGFIKNELDDYQCNRLGHDKRWCVPKEDVEAAAMRETYYTQADPSICPKCHKKMGNLYCPTCSGQRIIGFKCECGFSIGK
jgi:hypothetical protein